MKKKFHLSLLRKYSNVAAQSVLESVIALSIIAVCLYIAVLVYSQVFTSKTSVQYYNTKNKLTTLYYMSQVYPDSVLPLAGDDFEVRYERVTTDLLQVTIHERDSIGAKFQNQFYIRDVETE
ncbi:hypothetical protein GCM10022386_08120 [Flavobacterium cheonhonense]|uniref:Uncharacterized protein n=1 Tax=Flavobacterium cheonhonense TaxID=706185 RepID=A0ABP7TJL0_9FLAO|nr:hypothetical protein [Flavobacterium cheonhonense]